MKPTRTDRRQSLPKKPLRLVRETLRTLSDEELVMAAGGRSAGCYRAVPAE